MSTDYKPNSLAIKIIRLFLANRHLVVSADRLADMFGTTPTQVRQTLAPAVGRKIVERETNALTGEQDYAAGRHLSEMEHLAERERSEKAWDGYREALYEKVDLKMRLEAVQKAINGEKE